MKKTLEFLVIAMVFIACSKARPESGGDSTLTGKWNLDMIRADPGDGSGRYVPISELNQYPNREKDLGRVIEFKADGTFTDSDRPQFNRYSRQDDVITLTSTANSETYHFYIEELNGTTLALRFEGLWCGGPYGEKFVR